MFLSYDTASRESVNSGSKDKKRTLTHFELLDKYYDEGKMNVFALSPNNREKTGTV